MAYELLGKLFFGDPTYYRSIYENRFYSSDSVILNFKIKENIAFFVQTSEIANLVIQILRADKRIDQIKRSLPIPAIEQFAEKCLIGEIILTNKIEGVHTDRSEVGAVLAELRKKSEAKKVRNRFNGLVMKYTMLQSQELTPLDSCKDIRHLYDELVLPEVVSENPDNIPDGKIFRKNSTSVYDQTDKEIHRGLYPESAIQTAVTKALSFLHQEDVEPLYRICIFHYLLEYIHPFYDGNGRLGRFIISDLLSKQLDPLIAYRLSYTIITNINKYNAAFKTCNDPHNLGDLTPFLTMMMEMILESVNHLEEALSKRKILLDRYAKATEKLGGTVRTRKTYYLLTQATLFAEHGVSIGEIEDYLEVSYSTAKGTLSVIKSSGLLMQKKVSHSIYYSLDLEKLDKLTSL